MITKVNPMINATTRNMYLLIRNRGLVSWFVAAEIIHIVNMDTTNTFLKLNSISMWDIATCGLLHARACNMWVIIIVNTVPRIIQIRKPHPCNLMAVYVIIGISKVIAISIHSSVSRKTKGYRWAVN
jgi:uncharacterized membrane protein (UPF0136 family)